MPQLAELNKRLASKIDGNWQLRFQWLQWELCKMRWYIDALENGVCIRLEPPKPPAEKVKRRLSFFGRRTSAEGRPPRPVFGEHDDSLSDTHGRFEMWRIFVFGEGCDRATYDVFPNK